MVSGAEEDMLWKQRYRLPTYVGASVAEHAPTRGLVSSDCNGVMQLYAWDRSTGALEVKTNSAAGKGMGWISHDGEWVFFHKDLNGAGSEIGHYVAIKWEGGEPDSEIDLTPELPSYAASGFAESKDGGTLALSVAVNRGNTIYIKEGVKGSPKEYHRVDSLVQIRSFELSHCGRFLLITSNEHTVAKEGKVAMDFALNVYDLTKPAGSAPIAQLWDGATTSLSSCCFRPAVDGHSLLIAGATSESGFHRPLLWEPLSDKRSELVGVSDVVGQLVPLCWNNDGSKLLLQQLHNAETKLCLVDLHTGEVGSLPELPKGVYITAFFEKGGHEIVVGFANESAPFMVLSIDDTSGAPLRGLLPSDATAWQVGGRVRHSFESVLLTSENGDSVQGWLALPGDESEGPWPTILHMHGGPTAIQLQSFNPEALAWLDAGFAWFSINYHGSTDFGKDWEQSIHGRLGTLEVQDMAGAHAYLVQRGVSKPDAIFLQGGSYGGYLTLLGMGVRPELWAGGMAAVAIADWKLMYEDQADTLRGYQRALFKGSPEETPEATAKSSPITYVKNVLRPLLVIQGRNDTRCPARQLIAYEEAMKAAGKEIDVQWFSAGHGSGDISIKVEHQELAMRFALRVLARKGSGPHSKM